MTHGRAPGAARAGTVPHLEQSLVLPPGWELAVHVPPPAEGSRGVMYPGEPEYHREQQRRQDGIDVEDATWQKLQALASEYGLEIS